eukprot:m.130747 g.130747  ORF g.130747 m.130747 type:complete len:71 (-) comp14607_c0_seq1:261-473(-)
MGKRGAIVSLYFQTEIRNFTDLNKDIIEGSRHMTTTMLFIEQLCTRTNWPLKAEHICTLISDNLRHAVPQ